MDEFKPEIGNDEVWRSDLSISIQGNYKVEDKKCFMNVFEYFCTEIVRDKDIYCVLFSNNVNLFDKYMDSAREYQGKTLYKLKKYEDIKIMQYYVAQQLKEQAHG